MLYAIDLHLQSGFNICSSFLNLLNPMQFMLLHAGCQYWHHNTNCILTFVQRCAVDCTGEQGWLVRAGSLLCMGYYWAGVTVIYNWGVKNQQPAASKYEMEDGWWKRWDRCMFIQRISEGGTKIFAELLTWTKCLVNLQIQNWFKHLKDYLGLSIHRWV